MKTRTELLAQLEAEQAAGDPSWEVEGMFRRVLDLVTAVVMEADTPYRKNAA